MKRRLIAPRKPAPPFVPDDPFQHEAEPVKTPVTAPAPSPTEGEDPSFYVFERDGVTQGLLDKVLTCPMKATLAQVGAWSTARFKGAIAFGNAVHAGLEHAYSTFWDTKDATLAIASVQGALATHQFCLEVELTNTGIAQSPDIEQEVEEIYATADILLRHYFRFWESDFHGGMNWEGLEETFRVPYQVGVPTGYGGPVDTFLRGKIDGRYREKNRRKWLMDHKTKSRIEEDAIMDRLHFDLQTRFYAFADWKQSGEQAAGMLYNILRRPQLKRKAAETLPDFLTRIDEDIQKRAAFYFMRYEVALSPKDYEDFADELESMLRVAYAWYRGSYHYRNSAACESKYGLCEFMRVCSRQDYGSLYQREDPFPELVTIETERKP